MSFLNSSEPDSIAEGEWKPDDNCLICRPLPDTGVGLLKISIDLRVNDDAKSSATFPATSLAPFGVWMSVLESSTLYCQVRASLARARHDLCHC